MSDLTDEEIIATRKLNGVDDDLYRKIDVGEYIKTNKGNIGKIIEIRLGFNKDTQLYQDIYKLDNGLWTVLDYIVKHSKQLIDLIEGGDYVNGYRVKAVYLEGFTKYIKLDNAYENGQGTRTYEETIKTILTKEQVEANQYVIE